MYILTRRWEDWPSVRIPTTTAYPWNNHSLREFLLQSEQAASIAQTTDGIDRPSTDMQERYIFHHAVIAYHWVRHVWPLGYSMLRAMRRRALVPAASWLDGHPVHPILLTRCLASSLLRTENGSRNIPNTMCGLVGTFLISAKMFLIPCVLWEQFLTCSWYQIISGTIYVFLILCGIIFKCS